MQNRKRLSDLFNGLFDQGSEPRKTALFARWFTMLDLSGGKIFDNDQEEEAISRRMAQNLRDHFFPQKTPKTFRIKYWRPMASAAALLLIGSGLLFLPNFRTQQRLVYMEAWTVAGQRKIITLSDGSTITMNNSSRVKFPRVFSAQRREVELEGEAFFTVAHYAKKPFIVTAGNLHIQVLGTSFNVNSYAGGTIKVIVATGKVGVYTKKESPSWMLTPGSALSFSKATGKAILSTVNASDYTDWQKGELVFKNDRLADVCERLERYYGVSILIKSEALKTKRISMKLNNETLATVLKQLGIAGGFTYEFKQERTVWISKT